MSKHAFGNCRELLKDVTYTPAMAKYLTYLGNHKSRGRLIQSVLVEQYAATLGGRFGLDQSELSASLPNLNNFAQKDLGILTSGSA